MSWLDSIVDFGGKVVDFLGSPIGGALARTVISGYAVNKINKSITKANQTQQQRAPDAGNRIQLDPDTEAKIPLVYGTAFVPGIVTDARMYNNNKSMAFCITLCERTGVKLSDGVPSGFDFLQIYWNDSLVVLENDGFTVKHLVDRTNTINARPAGLVKVYCFRGSSIEPTSPEGYSWQNLDAAYEIIPGWTSNHMMNDLIFVVVTMTYNREREVTGLGTWRFKLRNTMTLPGDVLYDVLTSNRYGAGMVPQEINQ